MEALAKGSKCREDTLYVHNNRFAGSCQNYVLLLQEVAGHGDSAAHRNLVGGTADTGYGDSLCAEALRVSDHLRIIRILADHLRKTRIMSVYNDIYIFCYHNAQVCLRLNGLRRSEQYV